jgi:PBSX family phage terminase large subunit
MRYRGGEVLISGPAGTGKSRTALEKIHMICLLTPNVRCLIVRKTAVSLATSALKTYERDVAAKAMLDGTVSFYGGSAREPAQYRYSNGSSITIGGMDKPMKIMSTEYDVVFAQEATELTVDDWEAITTRLRNGVLSFQQLIADCNPQEPTHWLKLRCEAGKTLMLHSRHQDNPRYFAEDGTKTTEGEAYMARLDELTGVRRLRLRDGLWAAAEGVIYEEFDPALHVIDPFPVPDSWRRLWSIDFGYVNPFVWQEWAIDPDDRMILVREIYRTQTLVEDHARAIKALQPVKPYIVLCDHDAEDRATLERHIGYPTRPASKNVSDGIQATAARFRLDGRGRARIAFMCGATVRRDQLLVDVQKPASTVEELPGYVWNDRGKDEPLKENDHGMDALRYAVMERDVSPRPRVRFM